MSFSPVGLTPLILVFDRTRSLAFYRDLPGFGVVFGSPEVETADGRFSHSMGLRFGGAEVMLQTPYDSNERPLQAPEKRARELCFLSAARVLSLLPGSRRSGA
jgi:hypothetical protein